MGFGGSNANIVLEEVPNETATSRTQLLPRAIVDQKSCDSEFVAFSGRSTNDLLAKLAQLERRLAGGLTCSLGDLAFSLLQEIDINHKVKLALICRDVPHLCDSIAQGRRIIETGNRLFDEDGWYLTPDGCEPIGKVACIFPGVGFPGLIGNYPDHLMELCLHFPEVAKSLIKSRCETSTPTISFRQASYSRHREICRTMRRQFARANCGDEGPRNAAGAHRDPSGQSKHRGVRRYGDELGELEVTGEAGRGRRHVVWSKPGRNGGVMPSGIFDIREIVPRFWDALSVSPAYAGKGRLAFVQATEAS